MGEQKETSKKALEAFASKKGISEEAAYKIFSEAGYTVPGYIKTEQGKLFEQDNRDIQRMKSGTDELGKTAGSLLGQGVGVIGKGIKDVVLGIGSGAAKTATFVSGLGTQGKGYLYEQVGKLTGLKGLEEFGQKEQQAPSEMDKKIDEVIDPFVSYPIMKTIGEYLPTSVGIVKGARKGGELLENAGGIKGLLEKTNHNTIKTIVAKGDNIIKKQLAKDGIFAKTSAILNKSYVKSGAKLGALGAVDIAVGKTVIDKEGFTEGELGAGALISIGFGGAAGVIGKSIKGLTGSGARKGEGTTARQAADYGRFTNGTLDLFYGKIKDSKEKADILDKHIDIVKNKFSKDGDYEFNEFTQEVNNRLKSTGEDLGSLFDNVSTNFNKKYLLKQGYDADLKKIDEMVNFLRDEVSEGIRNKKTGKIEYKKLDSIPRSQEILDMINQWKNKDKMGGYVTPSDFFNLKKEFDIFSKRYRMSDLLKPKASGESVDLEKMKKSANTILKKIVNDSGFEGLNTKYDELARDYDSYMKMSVGLAEKATKGETGRVLINEMLTDGYNGILKQYGYAAASGTTNSLAGVIKTITTYISGAGKFENPTLQSAFPDIIRYNTAFLELNKQAIKKDILQSFFEGKPLKGLVSVVLPDGKGEFNKMIDVTFTDAVKMFGLIITDVYDSAYSGAIDDEYRITDNRTPIKPLDEFNTGRTPVKPINY